MDPKTLQLLSCLRENSREKLTDISKKTGIPISTLFDLLKEMQQSIITKHTILLDFGKLGYHTRAQVFLKVAQEDKDKLKKHLLLQNNVNRAYKTNNRWDFILETIHQNLRELDTFLEKLNDNFKVEDKEIHYLVEELKEERFEIG